MFVLTYFYSFFVPLRICGKLQQIIDKKKQEIFHI